MTLCPSCGMDRYDHCTACRGCLTTETSAGLVCADNHEGPTGGDL